MRLEILIPTLPERKVYLDRLLMSLNRQILDTYTQVKISIDSRDRNLSIGAKRNVLLANAVCDYVVFMDDDDHIGDTYVVDVLDASDSKPDVVTFNGWMTTNGRDRKDFVIKLGERYEERGGKYYRWPNHIVPMRRELIQHVKFPDIRNGEDYQWSKQIHDQRLLKTSVHIDKHLYHYDYNSRK